MASDFYTLLGIPYNATAEEIRRAYFTLAHQLHPDVNPDPAVYEDFLAVQEAYEVLSTPNRKQDYDAALPAELRMGPKISVNVRYSRAALPLLSEPQLTYALVDLVCTSSPKADHQTPCHICLVIDRSTSMQGVRMDMVKASFTHLVRRLRPSDVVSVVTFSDRAEVLLPPERVGKIHKADTKLNLLSTSGGTEILQGLLLGLEQIRSGEDALARHILLLTDGHTYGDEEGCLNAAREAADEGIIITPVGIGNEWNDQLMDQVATICGSSSVFVRDPQDLARLIWQRLSDVGTVYARGLKFEFESDPGVALRCSYRISPNTGPLQSSSPMALGDIHHRKSIRFLIEFLIPPLSKDVRRITLAKGQIWMDLPGHRLSRTRIPLDLHQPVFEHVPTDPPPAVIVEAMGRLTLHRMQERAGQALREGRFEQATQRLQYLATHLLAQGDQDLARAVLAEAENIQQTSQVSGEGQKRIKFGTRALLLPSGSELSQ